MGDGGKCSGALNRVAKLAQGRLSERVAKPLWNPTLHGMILKGADCEVYFSTKCVLFTRSCTGSSKTLGTILRDPIMPSSAGQVGFLDADDMQHASCPQNK